MQELSTQITVTFDELFKAVSYLEGHEFQNDVEYFQSEHIQIETEYGYNDIKGLIKKVAPLFKIILEDASIIKCADKHILFDASGEKFAADFKIGDLVKTSKGYIPVISIEKIAESADVFDLEVDNSSHTYLTANGVIHHNTSITAAISHAYGQMGYKVITIVPSSDLVDQTAEWYTLLGMDVGIYSGENKDIDHTHVVATWQALQYNPTIMQEFQGVIWDECFSGTTPIVMHDLTLKPIKDVKVGDHVMSKNENGAFEQKKVTHVHKNLQKSKSSKMLRLYLTNGNTIDVTENHEFYTVDGRKIKAKDLTHDDELCEFSIKF